jgi:hypothetical protein
MSTAPVIDIRYRLRPEDIGRSGIYVTIQNVSWQGVEQLAPLLHLREFPGKRLLLDPQQQQALIQITGSAETRAWVGQVLLLQVVATPEVNTATAIDKPADPWRIQLFSPNQIPITLPLPQLPWQLSDQTRKTLILLLLLLLLFLAVTILDSSENAWQWLLG